MKKFILFIVATLIVSASFSQTRYRKVSLDTTSVLVNTGYTVLHTLNIAYPGTAIVYVKFYDSKAKPVISSAAPVITLQVGTDATLSYKLQSYDNVKFTNGLWIRCVTSILDTAALGVQPATKPLIEITY